jgi:hypothetical protein
MEGIVSSLKKLETVVTAEVGEAPGEGSLQESRAPRRRILRLGSAYFTSHPAVWLRALISSWEAGRVLNEWHRRRRHCTEAPFW